MCKMGFFQCMQDVAVPMIQRKKFHQWMETHDVISWNSLLSVYAHHGHGREVVELFEKMRRTEISTFLASAC